MYLKNVLYRLRSLYTISHVSYLLDDVFHRYLRVRFLIVEQTDAYALELYLSELLH